MASTVLALQLLYSYCTATLGAILQLQSVFTTSRRETQTKSSRLRDQVVTSVAGWLNITVRRFLRKRRRGCVYAETCVYARGCVTADPHPLCVHTHRSRIRTDPRIHTRGHICTRCVYTPTTRVNAPIRVYAPGCVYAPAAYMHPTLRIRGDATNVMERIRISDDCVLAQF